MKILEIHTIIVNYNGLKYNNSCIYSLLEQEGIVQSVTVVDNASTDGSLFKLHEEFGEKLHYIALPKNILFAAGCNIGIRKVLNDNAEYIFLINNDTIVAPSCLQLLVETLNVYPKVAAVQPVLTRMDNPQIIASAGCFISRMGGCWDKDSGKQVDSLPQTHFLVSGVTGGASLWRADVLREIGLFDEDFGMYFEDVDLSLRVRKAGYELYTIPCARVRHWCSATTNAQPSGFCVQFCQTNALRLIIKHWPDDWFWKDMFIWCWVSMLALVSNIRLKNWGVSKGMLLGIIKGFSLLPRGCYIRLLRCFPENKCLKKWIQHDVLYPPADDA